MRTRTAIRAISLLSAAAVCLGAETLLLKGRADRADRMLRYQGEQAFETLCDAVSGMDASLKKTVYAVTPGMTAALCAEVYSRAQSAGDALSALPFSVQELESTASFLARTGDYAAYLLRRSGGGEDVSEEERENLRSLSDAAGVLSDNLIRLRSDLADGLVSADGAAALEAGLPSLSDSFLQMEQEFPEIPTLVYDGPFSSAAAERPPRMTAGAGEIGKEDALLVASGFLGVRTNLCTAEGAEEGRIPCWRIAAGDCTVCVSRQGGYVVRSISSRTPVRSALTVEEALGKAEEYLAAHGYAGLQQSYHVLTGHVLTVTWCGRQGDVICYPDMIKLAVAMDNGEVLRFDAAAWLTSHGPRELPEAAFTAGPEHVPEGLTLLSDRLAVIPGTGAEELYCRELTCETESGEHYLLYFNAVTGAQERILLLLEDDTGTLAL